MSQAGAFNEGTELANIETLTGNTGGPVGPDISGNVDVRGDGTIVIVAGIPGSNRINIIVNEDALLDFLTDSGTAEPSGGELNVLGGDLITTTGSGNTVTVGLDNGTNGQLIIGATGGSPAYASLTSSDGTVTFTAGANSLDLSVASAANAVDGLIPDMGTSPVEPDSNGDITITGAMTGLLFTGTTSTLTLGGTLGVATGGTGNSTLTDHGVLIGSGGSAVTVTTAGTNGQLLIAATGADPAFATLASADGSVTFTTGANSLDLSVDAAASGAVDGIIPDSGTSPVVPDSNGDITLTGGTTGLTFVGGTNTLTQQGTLVVSNGGTGATSLTDHGVLLGSGTSPVTVTSVGTNGQLLIGATGADPAFASLTSADSTISFSTGANTLDLTTGTTVATSFPTDSGTATPSSGALTLAGGTNMNTAGSGSTATFNLDDAVSLATSLTSPAINLTGATQHAVAIYGASGALSEVASLGTSGQVLTSNGAGSDPTWQDNTSFTWNEETGTSVTMSVNNGYVANNASLVTLTLPDTAAFGSVIKVVGKGDGGWQIAQNTGEQIIWDESTSTTTGTGGSLASTDDRDFVELLCTTADTTWTVLSSKGNITVT